MSITERQVISAIEKVENASDRDAKTKNSLGKITRKILNSSVLAPCPHTFQEHQSQFEKVTGLLEELVITLNNNAQSDTFQAEGRCLNCLQAYNDCECEVSSRGHWSPASSS